MLEDLADCLLESIKLAAQKLTGWKRREFQAEIRWAEIMYWRGVAPLVHLLE